MPNRLEVYVGNDNILELSGLRDGTVAVASAGDYANSQTGVVMNIVDANSAIVAGGTALSLSYVSGTSGLYRGTLPDTLSITAASKYRALVTADIGAGKLGYWDVTLLAMTRRQGD